MPVWLAGLVGIVLQILKGLFGLDKPQETEVKRAEAPAALKSSDSRVLRELGVRIDPGASNQDSVHLGGAGGAGGDPGKP